MPIFLPVLDPFFDPTLMLAPICDQIQCRLFLLQKFIDSTPNSIVFFNEHTTYTACTTEDSCPKRMTIEQSSVSNSLMSMTAQCFSTFILGCCSFFFRPQQLSRCECIQIFVAFMGLLDRQKSILHCGKNYQGNTSTSFSKLNLFIQKGTTRNMWHLKRFIVCLSTANIAIS